MGGDELAAEAAALKQKIRDARKEVCDTQMINETGSVEQLKISLRIRKTLRGHLSKVKTLLLAKDNTSILLNWCALLDNVLLISFILIILWFRNKNIIILLRARNLS